MKKFVKTTAIFLALLLCVTSIQPIATDAKTKKTKTVIKLNKTKATIRVGRSVKLKLKNAKAKKVKWSSSNKKVATVKKGLVTAKKKGKATITAKYKGKKYKAKITVKKKLKTVTPDYNTLKQGQIMVDDMYDGKNILVSPTSLNMVLGMASNGATDRVNSEIEKFMSISPKTYTTKTAPELMKFAKNEPMLSINNGVWYKTGYTLSQNFKDAVQKNYQAEVKDTAMDNNTANEINGWVSDKTDKMIPKIIDDIDPLIRAILVNAILFKGEWTEPFKAENTSKETFTTFSGSKSKVDMMWGGVNYYYENDKAIGFEKEYGDDMQFSMIAVLPKKKGNFKMADLNLKSFLKSKTDEYIVHVEMPKFTYEWSDDGKLNQSLMKNGVKTIFDGNSNPLGKVFTGLDESEKIYASDVMQSCKIIVDEEGTKAAAVTAMIMKATAMLPSKKIKEINLNRPFAYIIMDNKTGQALFVGKVVTIDK